MTELEVSLDKLKIREEALRRKEKEIGRKEDQVKDQLDQIRSMRAAMDATMQELEARELVMTDAESKHGSLLQREEAITRRERDVDTKEDTLRDRLVEATKREQEAAEFYKLRQREYEEKLFPLAAREQELVRREMEAQAMNHDLELKYKQLNKHVAAEEEKEKLRDKSFRDREQALRDQMSQTERRQQELEQLNTHLNEKQRLLKAEHVESDGRDRDIKWREEQLRLAQNELTELKTKLIKWEGKIAVDEEVNRVEHARLSMKFAEFALRESETAEKTNKLLALDEDIQRREELSKKTMDVVNESMQRAEQERTEVQATKRQAGALMQDLANREEQIVEKENRLSDQDKKLRMQAKVLDDKENAIKAWIMELQYREQNVTGTSVTTFHAHEVAGATLEGIQERYITMTSTSTAGTKKGSTTPPPARGGHTRMLLQPLSSSAPAGDATGQLHDYANTVAHEVRRCQLEDTVDAYMVALYAMPDDERRAVLTAADESRIKTVDKRNRELVAELQFLWQVLVGKQQPKIAVTASAARLTKELAGFGYQFTAVDWASYYQSVRADAVRRRGEAITECIANLTDLTALLEKCIGREALVAAKSAREDLKNTSGTSRIRHTELGKALPAGRASNSATIMAQLRITPTDSDDVERVQESPDDHVTVVVKSTKAPAPVSKRTQEMKSQLIASLPDYLRHHYEQ